MVDISIVILNYKMRSLLEGCLESVKKNIEASGLRVSVVVTDNESGDGVIEYVTETYPDFITIQNGSNGGFAKGINPGIKAVEARYYFILNPDTKFINDHTLSDLYNWMEASPKVGVVGPKLIGVDGKPIQSYHRFPSLFVQMLRRSPFSTKPFFKKFVDRFLMKDVKMTDPCPVDWVQGSALFIRKEAIDSVGLLDERFWMYFEDIDWCRRFWAHQFPVYFLPHITIVHMHTRGSAKIPGTIIPLFKNKLARAHLVSWARYFLKWGTQRPFKLL